MEKRYKNLQNLRYLSGTTADGRTISKKLCRGPKLDKISDEEIRLLTEKYEIKTVIDLRSRQEKNEMPDKVFCNYLFMPVFDKNAPGVTHEKQSKSEILKALPTMPELYGLMFRNECFENLKSIIKYVVNARENLYFHCTEGKDRTGVVAAVIYLILGVSKEDIYADYMLTNKVNHAKAKKMYYLVLFTQFNKKTAQKIFDLFVAKEEYLDALFSFINDEYGSVDAFIYDGLGLTKKEVEEFKDYILA